MPFYCKDTVTVKIITDREERDLRSKLHGQGLELCYEKEIFNEKVRDDNKKNYLCKFKTTSILLWSWVWIADK